MDISEVRSTGIVSTPLGAIGYRILSETIVQVWSTMDLFVNRIPHEVRGEFREIETYGYTSQGKGWGPTGKTRLVSNGFRPIRRKDKEDWQSGTPTDNARKKIESAITDAILPILVKAQDTGLSERERLRGLIRDEYAEVRRQKSAIEYAQQKIQEAEARVERYENKIQESLLRNGGERA